MALAANTDRVTNQRFANSSKENYSKAWRRETGSCGFESWCRKKVFSYEICVKGYLHYYPAMEFVIKLACIVLCKDCLVYVYGRCTTNWNERLYNIIREMATHLKINSSIECAPTFSAASWIWKRKFKLTYSETFFSLNRVLFHFISFYFFFFQLFRVNKFCRIIFFFPNTFFLVSRVIDENPWDGSIEIPKK